MIPASTYEKIKSQNLFKLEQDLPKDLFYHGIHHTLDVLEQAERIAKEENISGKEDLLLLKIACLYHDRGFLIAYGGHEEIGCKMAGEELPGFGFSEMQIKTICGLIMATKIPQTPLTKLEQVICDADLDYLGRPDFFKISDTLFYEMKERGMIKSERDWNLKQISFFNSHTYFTSTSKKFRAKEKQKHLEMIEAKI